MCCSACLRAQVANRDGAVRLAAEVDVPQDQLDRHARPVGMDQLGLDRLIRAFQYLEADPVLGYPLLELGTDHAFGGRSDQNREVIVDRCDGFVVANDETFDGRVRKPAHAFGFELAASAVAYFERYTGKCEENDDKAGEGHGDREHARRQGHC